jgi:hypothetical protein
MSLSLSVDLSRVWEDVFSEEISTIQPTFAPPSPCMITYLSLPTKAMFVHPCNLSAVKSLPIMTNREYLKERAAQRGIIIP